MPNTRNNAAFDMRYHLVLVTKYRKKSLLPEMQDRAKEILAATLASWRCELIEFGAEEDHIHVLFSAHPALDPSALVNNLKTVSSRLLRKEYWNWLRGIYTKPVFWHGAYYLGTVGTASLETVRRYIENQGVDKWPQKRREAQKSAARPSR